MARKSIIVLGDGVRKELTATAVAITPGFLVERAAGGTVQAHSNAGQTAQKAFAVEDDMQGKEIGDNYAASAVVQFNVFKAGDEVLALLDNGEKSAIGDFVESAGNGRLRVNRGSSSLTEYPSSIVGIALEVVDMSDSSAADPTGRILIEIM